MALNRVAINNDLLNKNTFTQSVDPNLASNSSVGSFKPTEITVDPNSIIIDRQLTNKSSIQSANLSKTVIDNSYTKQQDESPSFTSKLLNFIEPYDFGGVLKTVFYSEISTNFNVGDKVFISNGPYDSPVNTSSDKFAKGTDGYEVLAIDGCKIVLDINYVGLKPYNDIDTNDLIFLHNVTSQKEFEYINSIKTYVLNDTVTGEILTQFIGESDGTNIISYCGHFIRVGPSDNFIATTDMTAQSIFGLVTGGASGQISGRILYREYLTANQDWTDCTSFFNGNHIQLYDLVANPTLAVGNKRLYTFGPDFDFNGTTFKEGVIYKFNDVSGKWEMDQSFKPAYISKLYFIEGTFIGNHRAGLFGTYNKKNVWEGKGQWQGGTVLNSVWKSGRMDSRTKVGDAVIRAKISEDGKSVIQSVDTTNNSGTGYNLIVDSTIEQGSFYQANFKNCFLGKSTGNSAMKSYFDKTDPSQFFNLYLDSSSVTFCDIQDTILSSTTIYDSVVSNSTLLGSKLSNGQIKNSVFNGGEYNADSGITILGAEINSYDRDIMNNLNLLSIYGILKLFISENDYFRMSKGDSFYIEKVNKEYFLNSLSDHYKIHLPYETKYILDTYWDYEFSDDATNRPNSVSFRDKKTNKYKFFVERNEDSELTIQKIQPKVGTYWEDITTIWEGAWTPGFDNDITGQKLCYVYFDHGSLLPLYQGNSSGNKTYHIFKTRIPPDPNPIFLNGEGPAPIDGYNTQPDWELAFTNAFGPAEPTSPGQYRGEFSTDPNTIARTIAGGLNYYQKNDVVAFYNPIQQRFYYYKAKLDMPTNINNNVWSEIGFFQIADAGDKAFISEPSEFQNYCSIDIETGLLGWYRNTKGGVTNDVWTKNKIAPNGFEQLMPIKLIDEIFKNVQIKNANFESGVFVNANWVSGSYINDYDNIISKISLDKSKLDMTQAGGDLSFPVRSYSTYNRGRIQVNDYVWIDPIRYVDPTPANSRNLSSLYTMKLITNPTTTTKTNTLLSSVGFNSSPSGRFEVNRSPYTSHASIHKVIIENSTIYGGKFKRANFKNTTFKSRVNYTKPQSNLIDPKEIPLLINIIFSGNNLTVENGVIYQSQLLDFKATGGYAYYCYANGATMSGIQFQNGYWINGTFDGGKFIDCRKSNLPNIQTNYLQNIFLDNQLDLFTWWLRGSFLSGEFHNSDWVDGVFNNGKFWNSDWYGGTWSNGILGDKSIPSSKTTFGSYPQLKDSTSKWFGNSASNWYGGECQNGVVGGNGRVYWYGGRMVGGEFTSTDYNSNTQSIWYDGIFDGSTFTNKAKWKNGTFNNGKFLANWNVALTRWGYSPALQSDYVWENGIFNGGQFGSGDGNPANNSAWGGGIFNGGLFIGRFWRDGVFTGGIFRGNGTRFVDVPFTSKTNANFETQFLRNYVYTDITGDNQFYGLWNDGVVIENSDEVYSDNKVSSDLIRATDVKKKKTPPYFETALWVNGTFSHESGTFKNSLFSEGNFVKGIFDGGVFNPFVPRKFIPPNPIVGGIGSTDPSNFATQSIKWTNGTFVTGSFFCSVWENGTFKDGYMAGAHWKNGLWEYGEASNIYWSNGIWKNGNWSGAPFTSSSIDATNPPRMTPTGNISRNRSIVLSTARFMNNDPNSNYYLPQIKTDPNYGNNYLYISNIFSASTPFFTKYQSINVHPNNSGFGGSTNLNSWTFSNKDQYFGNQIRQIYLDQKNPRANVYDIYALTASFWSRQTTRLFNVPDGNVVVRTDLNGLTYAAPASILNIQDQSGGEDHYNLFTNISPIQSLPYVPTSPPYIRGYNNFDKGWRLDKDGTPLTPPPNPVYMINIQDSAPSAKIYARINGTTSVFTQSNTFYQMSLVVSVELQKEVEFDVWCGGLSFSRFKLTSDEYYYYDMNTAGGNPMTPQDLIDNNTTPYRHDFLVKLYRITFNYFTTDELLTLKDGKLFWVKKNSRGILRIFKWEITTQKVEYLDEYTNFLYPGITFSSTGNKVEFPSFPNQIFSSNTRQGYQISVNFGNGYFRSGIWETGVWNSGWRSNSSSVGFFRGDDILRAENIISAVKGSEETQWFITIQFIDSLNDYLNLGYNIVAGSKVSISNLASYDNTNKRRVIESIMEVVEINFDPLVNTAKFLYKTQSPISYITKDSERHLIYVTSNIWKNGAFLNGVFRGVWNNGIFLGSPYHTEMIDSHFIDGYIDGAHFISQTLNDSASIYPTHQTGLIQRMSFRDRNIGTVGRRQYKTWLDLNFDNNFKSHLKKAGSVFRSKRITGQLYGSWTSATSSINTTPNVPNVAGFASFDVLESRSLFREINSADLQVYKLGTKRTIYSNALPNDGNFSTVISDRNELRGLVGAFSSFGLTYALIRQQAKNGGTVYASNFKPFTFSISSNTSDLNNGLLSVEVLDPMVGMHDYSFLLRNTSLITLPNRYYEFSMKMSNPITMPGRIYMDDVTQYLSEIDNSDVDKGDFATSSEVLSSLVNHASTTSIEKKEYFYNKANVDIYFEMASPISPRTSLDNTALVPPESFPPGPSAISIENISLYEVDMIPFFNYFTTSEIDRSINTQFYSRSPKIETGQKDFEFVDDSRLTVPYEILLQQNPSIEITNRETTSATISYTLIINGGL